MQPMGGGRVVFVGNSGSGKSTSGHRLATRLGIPHVDLDALYWEPGWTGARWEVFRQRVGDAIAGDAWVVSGNYLRAVQDLVWSRVDTVAWLDVPLHLSLRRLTARSWRRWRRDELLWGTNRESMRMLLKLWDPERSLLAFAVQQHRPRRRLFEEESRDPRWAHVCFVRMRSPAQVDRFIAEYTPPEQPE